MTPEGVGSDRLDVALLRQDDDDFLVFDEIERVEVAGVDGEASPALVAVSLAELAQLVLDDRAELLLAPQDRLELLDLLAELAQLVAQLLALELREPPELHVEDEVRLDLAELERLLHQPRAGGVDVSGGPDELDDRVDHVEGAYEPLDDVLAFTRLVDPVLRTPRHHFHLVRDVHQHRLRQVQQLWDPVDERQHVHREARLHRRVLVELVQDDLRIGVAAQLDHEASRVTGRLVADVLDAIDLALVHELGDLLADHLDRRLVGHLGDDDSALTSSPFFDVGDGSHLDRASAGAVRVLDPVAAEDEGTGREVRPLHEAHQVVRLRVRVVEHVDAGVDDLVEVVRRDVRRHPDRNPAAAVDEQVGEPCRQDDGLLVLAVVGVGEVDGVLVDLTDELHRERGETRFGVPLGGRAVVRVG